MSRMTVRGGGLLAAAVTTAVLRVAAAQHHHPHADTCTEGQHRSGSHCCNPGEAWVDEREACVCLDPAGCHAPVPVAAAVPVAPVPLAGCPDGMVSIQGGSFFMGSATGDGEPTEQPQHRVNLSPYCIDRTEITVGQYRTCAQTRGCSPAFADVSLPGLGAADQQLYSGFCNGARTDRDNHPINCVDWSQADAYCLSRNGRLPTEAEWEFAARGTEGRIYPWGNNPPAPALLNACDNGCRSLFSLPGRPAMSVMFPGSDNYDNTAPVGSYQAGASPFGVLDMGGNVMEWTADWFGPYVPGAATDPVGPSSGSGRVVRGGSWFSTNPDAVRTAFRSQATQTAPGNRLATLGFRCVLHPEPAPAPPPPAPPPVSTGRHGH